MLHIHHLLDDGSGVNTRKVIVFKNRSERHSAGSDHQIFSIHIEYLVGFQVLDRNPLAFEQIPNGGVEADAGMVVASQLLGDVETAHSAINLLFFKEEELVRLHVELTSDTLVIVDDDVGDALLVESFATGQTGGARANDGDLRLVNFQRFLFGFFRFGEIVLGNFLHFFHTVNRGDADTFHLAIYQHLACTAFADAASETAFAPVKAMAMYRETRLMQRRCNCITLITCYFFAVVLKNDFFGFGDVQNRMFCDSIHIQSIKITSFQQINNIKLRQGSSKHLYMLINSASDEGSVKINQKKGINDNPYNHPYDGQGQADACFSEECILGRAFS